MLDARITEGAIDLDAEHRGFVEKACQVGAVVTFAGIARGSAGDGARVERLFLDHHPTLTLRSVHDIVSAAASRFGLAAAAAVHRYGVILPGEPIVFVAAASRHRRAAFDAADFMMDRLKTEALFWKREDSASGSRWVDPTDADHAARARWSAQSARS